jgi:predicted methyltransferase
MTSEEASEEVSDCLDRIKACFKPGVKVMVLVRTEGDAAGKRDFVMGDDDPQEAMNMLARRMAEYQRS